jgi:peptidylprolyl isomerase
MNGSIKRAGIILGILATAFAAFFALSIAAPHASMAQDTGQPHWILELKDGTVDIELLPDLAPNHVARVIELTKQGFYNGIVFHRVIDGFMAQGGDPTGTGAGGSDLPDLKAEFTNVPFMRGTFGAARASSPDSANSQFFIMYGRKQDLDNNYTVMGRVVAGMDAVDGIAQGEPPAQPTTIVKAWLGDSAPASTASN